MIAVVVLITAFVSGLRASILQSEAVVVVLISFYVFIWKYFQVLVFDI